MQMVTINRNKKNISTVRMEGNRLVYTYVTDDRIKSKTIKEAEFACPNCNTVVSFDKNPVWERVIVSSTQSKKC